MVIFGQAGERNELKKDLTECLTADGDAGDIGSMGASWSPFDDQPNVSGFKTALTGIHHLKRGDGLDCFWRSKLNITLSQSFSTSIFRRL